MISLLCEDNVGRVWTCFSSHRDVCSSSSLLSLPTVPVNYFHLNFIIPARKPQVLRPLGFNTSIVLFGLCNHQILSLLPIRKESWDELGRKGSTCWNLCCPEKKGRIWRSLRNCTALSWHCDAVGLEMHPLKDGGPEWDKVLSEWIHSHLFKLLLRLHQNWVAREN